MQRVDVDELTQEISWAAADSHLARFESDRLDAELTRACVALRRAGTGAVPAPALHQAIADRSLRCWIPAALRRESDGQDADPAAFERLDMPVTGKQLTWAERRCDELLAAPSPSRLTTLIRCAQWTIDAVVFALPDFDEDYISQLADTFIALTDGFGAEHAGVEYERTLIAAAGR